MEEEEEAEEEEEVEEEEEEDGRGGKLNIVLITVGATLYLCLTQF